MTLVYSLISQSNNAISFIAFINLAFSRVYVAYCTHNNAFLLYIHKFGNRVKTKYFKFYVPKSLQVL